MVSDGWRQGQRDDFTLFELLNALWGRRVLVGGVALALVVGSLIFSLSQASAYVSEAAVAVQPEVLGVEGSETLAQETIISVADDRALTRNAIRRAGWTASPEEFGRRVTVETSENSGEIVVSFTATTAERARVAADSYARTFVEEVERLGGQRLAGGTLETSASVTRPATLPDGRSSPRPVLYGAFAGAVGLLLGGALALALESRTRRWRGARDAELTLRAPVLGVIPDYHVLEERSEERVG